jgi:pyridoxamine 5'-phosphate oxidase
MSDHFAEVMVAFRELLDEARAAGDPEPTAMTVATSSPDGRISARTVLLKAWDERGFVFYTNHSQPEGPRTARPSTRRRCCSTGRPSATACRCASRVAVEVVSDAEADAYFASRPRMSQIGAWASDQSETLPSREAFDARIEADRACVSATKPVHRPPHWSGFRVVPDRIELWYGADFRLHERYLLRARRRRRVDEADAVSVRSREPAAGNREPERAFATGGPVSG